MTTIIMMTQPIRLMHNKSQLSHPKLFKQIQHQIIIIKALGIAGADLIAVPDPRAIRDVAALDIHPLRTAVTAVKPNAKIYRVSIL